MIWQDAINGAFELAAGFAILLNCRRMYIDDKVRGVSFAATVFFTSWGFWNLYYYPHLGQWMSFAGGVLLVAANCLWIGMMIHYKRRERNDGWKPVSIADICQRRRVDGPTPCWFPNCECAR